MKKTLLFTISFFSALTFGFAQTSISYAAAGATSQTFTVGKQATDNLQAGIAAITSATGIVTSNNSFIGLAAELITDNDVTGTFTFTLTTDSATSINTDLTLDIGKRKGISTVGTVSVTGYSDVAFNFASEGSTTGTEGKLIEFGQVSLISGTDLTVTITLTSMIHVESTQTGIFRLENVIVAGEAIVPTPTEISYDAITDGDQTFTVGQETTDDLQEEIATITSATGTVATNNAFIGIAAPLITDNDVAGTFIFTVTTDSALSIDRYLTLDITKRKGISTVGTISVTGYPDVAFNFASEGSTTGTEGKLIEFGEISLITGTDLTVTVTLTSMTHVESTQTGIFRLENVLVNTTAPLSIDDVAQTTVNFTAEEGFSDGALYNQSGWDSSFTGTTWMVDTSIGAITLSNDLQRAAWDYSFASSRNREILTFRVDLKFIGTFGTNNNPLLKIGFSSSSDVANSTPPASVVFLRTASSNTQLQLSNNDNSGPLSPNASLLIADCQATGESDDLAVLVTLTLGADAASSTISSKLMNLTDGTETIIGSYTGINSNIFTAATTTNIYGFLHAQTLTTTGNNAITQVQVSSVTMTHGDYLYSVVNKYGGSTSSSTNRINNNGKIGSGNLFVNKNGKIISY